MLRNPFQSSHVESLRHWNFLGSFPPSSSLNNLRFVRLLVFDLIVLTYGLDKWENFQILKSTILCKRSLRTKGISILKGKHTHKWLVSGGGRVLRLISWRFCELIKGLTSCEIGPSRRHLVKDNDVGLSLSSLYARLPKHLLRHLFNSDLKLGITVKFLKSKLVSDSLRLRRITGLEDWNLKKLATDPRR